MAAINLRINNPRVPTAKFEQNISRKRFVLKLISQLAKRLASGGSLGSTVQATVEGNMVAATGTAICASVQAADTVTINGVVFTAVSGAPAANQFDISGGNTTAGASLAAAINSSVSALVAGYVTATSATGTVTITSSFLGLAGNATTLASSNGTRLAVSAARLAGGAADASTKTYTF